MAHYLVTGGAGFIGSHLVERLLLEGHRVRLLDNFSTGRESNVEAASRAGADRLEVRTGDIRERGTVDEVVKGVDGVFHQAALGSVPRSIAEPLLYNDVNVNGTLNILLAARDAEVGRVLFAGSSSVYGSLEALPKKEDHPTQPISPYGLNKLVGENYLQLFHEVYGLETVTLRYYNVYGPRQDPKSQYAAVIPVFISRVLAGESPVIDGDGEQSRDFTFVSDVVEANLLAMTAPADRVGRLYNVAAGGRHSINELFEIVRNILGSEVRAIHGDPRPGDIRHSQADISRIQSELGFEPRVSFQEGLGQTVEYFRPTS